MTAPIDATMIDPASLGITIIVGSEYFHQGLAAYGINVTDPVPDPAALWEGLSNNILPTEAETLIFEVKQVTEPIIMALATMAPAAFVVAACANDGIAQMATQQVQAVVKNPDVTFYTVPSLDPDVIAAALELPPLQQSQESIPSTLPNPITSTAFNEQSQQLNAAHMQEAEHLEDDQDEMELFENERIKAARAREAERLQAERAEMESQENERARAAREREAERMRLEREAQENERIQAQRVAMQAPQAVQSQPEPFPPTQPTSTPMPSRPSQTRFAAPMQTRDIPVTPPSPLPTQQHATAAPTRAFAPSTAPARQFNDAALTAPPIMELDPDDAPELRMNYATRSETPITGQMTFAVTSSKGGSGKTTVAILLAGMISKMSQGALRVCVLDTDTFDGQVGSVLGEIAPTILNINNSPIIDANTIREFTVHHSDLNIDAILAPVRGKAAQNISNELYARVIDILQTMYHVVIIDTSVKYLEPLNAQVVYPKATGILFVTTFAITSVQGMAKALAWMINPTERNGVGYGKTAVVANMKVSGINMASDKVMKAAIGCEVISEIPMASKDMLTALNFGKFYKLLTHSEIGPAFEELTRTCLPGVELVSIQKSGGSRTARPAPEPVQPRTQPQQPPQRLREPMSEGDNTPVVQNPSEPASGGILSRFFGRKR